VARWNPFTHAVKLIRFAVYGQFNAAAVAIVAAWFLLCFGLAVLDYDPRRGLMGRAPRPA
jgi:ABC-2 type transport system permease protein